MPKNTYTYTMKDTHVNMWQDSAQFPLYDIRLYRSIFVLFSQFLLEINCIYIFNEVTIMTHEV